MLLTLYGSTMRAAHNDHADGNGHSAALIVDDDDSKPLLRHTSVTPRSNGASFRGSLTSGLSAITQRVLRATPAAANRVLYTNTASTNDSLSSLIVSLVNGRYRYLSLIVLVYGVVAVALSLSGLSSPYHYILVAMTPVSHHATDIDTTVAVPLPRWLEGRSGTNTDIDTTVAVPLPRWLEGRSECARQLTKPGVLEHWLGVTYNSTAPDSITAPAITASPDSPPITIESFASQIQKQKSLFIDTIDTGNLSSIFSSIGYPMNSFHNRVQSLLQSRKYDYTTLLGRKYYEVPETIELDFGQIYERNIPLNLHFPLLPFAANSKRLDRSSPAGFVTDSFLSTSDSNRGRIVRHMMGDDSLIEQHDRDGYTVTVTDSDTVACAAVLVPHIPRRVPQWYKYDKWAEAGPDALRASMIGMRTLGGYERFLRWTPITHPEAVYHRHNQHYAYVPFMTTPYNKDGERGNETVNVSGNDRQSLMHHNMVVYRNVTVELPITAPHSHTLTMKVRVSVRMELTLTFSASVNLGFNVLVADLKLPHAFHPITDTSPVALTAADSQRVWTVTMGKTPKRFDFQLLNSNEFVVRGVLEYSNWEWNPDPPHIEHRDPDLTPILLIDKYRIVVSESDGGSDRELPLCTSGDHAGYWAPVDSPYAHTHPPLAFSLFNTSFYPDTCRYRYYNRNESFQCLADNYPNIHWFGDSNSRRALRMMYSGNQWGYEMIAMDHDAQCEDQDDHSMAGQSWISSNVTRWPYPLPSDTAEWCHYEKFLNWSYIKMPAYEGEPLSCPKATGAAIYYRFLLGMAWKPKSHELFYNLIDNDYPQWPKPDLLIYNTGNWESQESMWQSLDQSLGIDSRTELNMSQRFDILIDLLEEKYVKVNPSIKIVFRPGNAWLTPTTGAIRRHTTLRIYAFSEKMIHRLMTSRIAANILLWDVRETISSLHDLERFAVHGASCFDGHSGLRQVELDNQILFNMLCNYQHQPAHSSSPAEIRSTVAKTRSVGG